MLDRLVLADRPGEHDAFGVVRVTSTIFLACCVVEVRTFRYALLDFRDRVNLHLVSPWSIDCPQILGHQMRQANLVTELRDG